MTQGFFYRYDLYKKRMLTVFYGQFAKTPHNTTSIHFSYKSYL